MNSLKPFMFLNSPVDTFQRFRSLWFKRIHSLPIVILMPHSACNCRCIMCDIWKDNKNLKQLEEKDIQTLLQSLRKLKTKEVLMSGGEALLNPNFFSLCRILKQQGLKISLLSTGLSLKQHAKEISTHIHEVIVSLDGNEAIHNSIRRVPNAYGKLSEGIKAIKELNPRFRISARTVIQKANFRAWPQIIGSARELGLDQISFLPADVSSEAFNRREPWEEEHTHQVQPSLLELDELHGLIEDLISDHEIEFDSRFIAESPQKIRNIGLYYSALYGKNPFPYKACNAPWVSAVIEADGNLRPCFFHPVLGNIRESSLDELLNSKKAVEFRKHLDVGKDPVCERCVCSLYLSPLKVL